MRSTECSLRIRCRGGLAGRAGGEPKTEQGRPEVAQLSQGTGQSGQCLCGAWEGLEVLGSVIIGDLWKRSGWGHLTLCFIISASGTHKAI